MNIYKRKSDGMIFCSPDGDGNIEGFDFLGADESITNQTKDFVTGVDKKGKAKIDTDLFNEIESKRQEARNKI